ncbi:hypothetical protein [Faecalibacillus intestinalis]|uniref:hypothetical protein n=1 Tax=Faecalibacillus intestinalis TaxID=1982626 RepID=UPI00351FDB3B
MNRDNFIYAAIITGSLDLIRDLPEGDEIDMCGKGRRGEGRRGKDEKRKLPITIIESKIRKCIKSTRTSNTK